MIYQIGRIENFSGNMGSVSGDAVVTTQQTIGLAVVDVRALIDQIIQHTGALGLGSQALGELNGYLDALRSEANLPVPKPGVLQGLLKSVRNVVEGAAGSIVASGILAHIDKIQF